MRNWVELNRAVWPLDGMPKAELLLLIREQCDELEAASGYHEAEELADIVCIALQAIESRGLDGPKTVMLRLLSRHLTYGPSVEQRARAAAAAHGAAREGR